MKYKDLPDSGNPQMTCVNEMCRAREVRAIVIEGEELHE
jgi:hypothetical protein